MSIKLMSLTLAGILSLQNVALARVDRTAGIGDEQIRGAQQNILSVKKDLIALDRALLTAQESIKNRDSKGHLLNGTAVTGAAIGLGLSVMGMLKMRKVGLDSAFTGVIMGYAAFLSTAASVGLSVTGEAVKPTLDVNDLKGALTQAEAEVQGALSVTKDEATLSLLKNLEGSLKSVEQTLINYSDKDSAASKGKLAAQLTQVAGAAIAVYGFTQRQSGALVVGSLMANAGNIGQIVNSLSDSEADRVIKEIESTRKAISSAAMALN
ncbi:hypothetical protein [Bdellovibrio sp.]|uniref:hypothetical protein n=1 Tax=Bdellovibrio sp. TaxID=28201 RepID=UPI0039E5D417